MSDRRKKTPEISEIVLFIAQIVLSFILVIVSLWHLSDHKCESRSLWYSMFTGAIAYLIPNPTIKPLMVMEEALNGVEEEKPLGESEEERQV